MLIYSITSFLMMNRMTGGITVLASIVIARTFIMMAPIVFAATPAFDIVSFGIVGKKPSMTVQGIAGSKIPTILAGSGRYGHMYFTQMMGYMS